MVSTMCNGDYCKMKVVWIGKSNNINSPYAITVNNDYWAANQRNISSLDQPACLKEFHLQLNSTNERISFEDSTFSIIMCQCNASQSQYTGNPTFPVDSMKCFIENPSLNNRQIINFDIKSEEVMCYEANYCSDNCLCCSQTDCMCRMKCPYGCMCYRNLDWTRSVISCNGNELTLKQIPRMYDLRMFLTELYFHHHQLTVLENYKFIYASSLKVLHLDHNKIKLLESASLRALNQLRILRLDHNAISSITRHHFSHLTNLEELRLDNNLLSIIEPDTFIDLKKLSILKLNSNRLSIFPFLFLKTITSLNLHDNLWTCQCNASIFLRQYMKSYPEVVENYKKIRCISTDAHSTTTEILHRTCQSTILNSTLRQIESNEASINTSSNIMFISSIILFGGSVCVLFAAAMYFTLKSRARSRESEQYQSTYL